MIQIVNNYEFERKPFSSSTELFNQLLADSEALIFRKIISYNGSDAHEFTTHAIIITASYAKKFVSRKTGTTEVLPVAAKDIFKVDPLANGNGTTTFQFRYTDPKTGEVRYSSGELVVILQIYVGDDHGRPERIEVDPASICGMSAEDIFKKYAYDFLEKKYEAAEQRFQQRKQQGGQH
jgi:hypothetical protein